MAGRARPAASDFLAEGLFLPMIPLVLLSRVARAGRVGRPRVPLVIPFMRKVVGTVRPLRPKVMMIPFLAVRLAKVAVLVPGVVPLDVAVVLALVNAFLVLFTLIKVVPTVDTPILVISEVFVILPEPLSRVPLFIAITPAASEQQHVARVDALLNPWVVGQHAPFGVFHRDFPAVKHRLLMQAPNRLVGSLARAEHNVRKAL